MRPSRLPTPTAAVLVVGVVVVVCIGLISRDDQPVRTESGQEVASSPADAPPRGTDGRATRLHGRSRALGPSDLRGADPAPPSTDPLTPADPWLPGGEPPPSESPGPEPVRVGPLPSARVSPTGDVVFGQAAWTTAAVPEGYELVCYLIGALGPTPPRLLPALTGLPQASPQADAGPDPWWARLAEALVEEVGRDRWPASDTLLAWDAEQAALYVQQDAEGHSRVTDLLERCAAGRLGTLEVVVEFDPSPEAPAGRLRVDVPWGRTVRAHHGSSWAFLDVPIGADFDVEIASDPFIALPAPPFVAGLDTGRAVSARRVETEDESDAIELEVAASQGQPRFEPGEVTPIYTNVPATIEVPQLGVARWRGRVPARPGKHHVQLDDGRSATLVVLAPQSGPRFEPAFVRHVLVPRRLPPGTSHARAPRSLMVTWQAPGPLQARTLTIPLVGHGPWRDGPPATGACTVDAHGLDVDPQRACPWPLAEGGVRIHAAVFPAGGVDVLDLQVERCDGASDERQSAPFLGGDWTHGDYRSRYETLSLPVCRVRVDTRRLYVAVGEEASVRLDDDAAVTFRVVLRRDE